ncbi:MAG: periplasmic flagellar collar protein FlcA, partial [Spirochaetales bacterium]
LGDFGAEFGVIEAGEEEAADEEAELNPAAAPPTERPESEGTDAGPGIHLTDHQFSHLKQTLDTLPLNLRTIVEELIAGGEFSEEEIKPLVDKLVAGDPPKSIARTAGGLKGEHIRLPRNYEVRRGVVFEEEKATFAWQFRHRFLPLARNAALAAIVLGVAVYLGFTYLYQPLYARSLYLQGLEQIEEDRYTVGNEFFDEAREVWQTEDWFYRYAESFIDKRQFRLAREKFDQLLEVFPRDREGLLGYADLESRILGNYEHAEELYDRVLDMDGLDYDGLLGAADNYLRWGERDRSKFEDARYHYARAYQNYGATDEILQRFMRYFVRTDNLGEVEPLVELFQEDRTEVEINPEIFAETAGYLLDHERITYIRDMLSRARNVDPELPDIHYQLARFYDSMDERSSQAVALQNARTLFPEYEPLGSRRLGMHIDTYTLSAEYYAEGEEYLTAEQYYAEAIDRYESARASDLVDVEERFGRMYAGLADIYYYQSGEYDAARENYESAEENEYSTNNMRYKLGWIEYRDEDYDGAIDRFETVSNSPSARNIRYALANTHYYRGNYFASETYLRELLDILEQERSRIGRAFDPEENPEHRNIVRYKVMANNNLGVVMARRFEQEGDRELRGDALYYLTNSTQDATDVTRDPRTAERSDTTDLAFLNQRYLLYPEQPYSLRIYRDLPIDLEDEDFFPAQL